MNDKFNEWLRNQPGVYPTVWEIALARKAWNAAIESQKDERFACHIDEKIGEIYYDCGFDYLKDKSACPETERLRFMGKKKTDCEYWRKVK